MWPYIDQWHTTMFKKKILYCSMFHSITATKDPYEFLRFACMDKKSHVGIEVSLHTIYGFSRTELAENIMLSVECIIVNIIIYAETYIFQKFLWSMLNRGKLYIYLLVYGSFCLLTFCFFIQL